MKNKEILTFDLGGTFIKYGVVNSDGEISRNDRDRTPVEYLEILQFISDTTKKMGIENDKIAISSPCNYYNGSLKGGSHIESIINKDIVGDLKKLHNIDCLIENDGNCAALCENWVGSGKDVDNLVCLVVGSGIGGGVIINNSLLKGKHKMAGDIGYMLTETAIKRNGTTTSLGTQGGTGMITRKAKEIDATITRAEDLFELEITNPELLELKSNMVKTLANGIINCLYIFDTEKILIGGEISKCQPFLDEVTAEINKIIDLLNGYDYYPKIEQTKFNNNSNLIGAGSLYFNPIGSI